MSDEVKKENGGFGRHALAGCVSVLLLLALISAGITIYLAFKADKTQKPEFIAQAEKTLEESAGAKTREAEPKPESKYDIDQTVGALYSIEKALAEAKSFEDLTKFVVQKDSELVAPDVAKLKYRIFDVYKDLIDSRDKLEDLNSLYNTAFGGVGDIVGLMGADPATGGISIDREQIKKIWEKRVSESKLRQQYQSRLSKSQDKFIDLLFDFARLNEKYSAEWDRLCSTRDRAYLAFHEKNWDEMAAAAAQAIEISPNEREAHILLAFALLERGGETDASSAKAIVEKLLSNSKGQNASAYLLRGMMLAKEGKTEMAKLDFDQAATYYPKQQEELENRLNLYKRRPFLNKSKEGRVIINSYRGVMSGAGNFSPDFQKAKIFLQNGEERRAKDKIFDHFMRRRQQGQWDKVFTDFRFCREQLGRENFGIAEDGNLDIGIEPAWIGNGITLTVNNRSGADIHNVSILLCVRFTDMFRGDYLTFPFGSPVALIPAGKSVVFGKENISEITEDLLGQARKWKDAIEFGAVLISDELVTWTPPMRSPEEPEKAQNLPADESRKTGTDKAVELMDNVIDKLKDSINVK